MNDILLVFGLPVVVGGLLAWAIIQLDPKRRARRATAHASARARPTTPVDIASRAWLAGQAARALVFVVAAIVVFWWWFFTH